MSKPWSVKSNAKNMEIASVDLYPKPPECIDHRRQRRSSEEDSIPRPEEFECPSSTQAPPDASTAGLWYVVGDHLEPHREETSYYKHRFSTVTPPRLHCLFALRDVKRAKFILRLRIFETSKHLNFDCTEIRPSRRQLCKNQFSIAAPRLHRLSLLQDVN
jgi:hypothetical protein